MHHAKNSYPFEMLSYICAAGTRKDYEIQSILSKNKSQESQSYFISNIIDKVASYFGLLPEQIMYKTRVSKIVLARSVAQYFIRNTLNVTFPEMGLIFNQDHSTVMHACQKVETMVLAKHDNEYKNYINELKYIIC